MHMILSDLIEGVVSVVVRVSEDLPLPEDPGEFRLGSSESRDSAGEGDVGALDDLLRVLGIAERESRHDQLRLNADHEKRAIKGGKPIKIGY